MFLWTVTLSAPLNALAHQPRKTPLPAYHAPVLPKPADDPAWHTIDYHAGERGGAKRKTVAGPRIASLTLLDGMGRLSRPLPDSRVLDWKRQLHAAKILPNATAARLHLGLGEVALGRDEQPALALWHFQRAQALSKTGSDLHGLAAYDSATTLFYEGAYTQSASAFRKVLTAKPALRGFDRRTCALWLKHANACRGYHDERAALGITEPPKLDPLCGASALAQSLKMMGRPYDKRSVLANMRVTGRGSNLRDVLNGAEKMGLRARAVQSDDAGLIALPKPLVAYVEHDHFVSLLRADKAGVSYLCSDCGAWPGGKINLTWAQWHKMEATAYGVICKPGSDMDNALARLAEHVTDVTAAPTGQNALIPPARTAQIPGVPGLSGDSVLLGRLRRHVSCFKTQNPVSCTFTPSSPECQCPAHCPTNGGKGAGGTAAVEVAVRAAAGMAAAEPAEAAREAGGHTIG